MINFITTILSLLIGSGITYWFGVRHLKTEAEVKVKIEKYNNLIKYLHGFVGNDVSAELKKKFFQEWETSWLYCSDEVFNAIKKMVEHVRDEGLSPKEYPDGHDKEGNEMLGEIIVTMRKDLLRKKTKLTNSDFIFWDVSN